MCVIRSIQHYTTFGPKTLASMGKILGHAISLHVCPFNQLNNRIAYINITVCFTTAMATIIMHHILTQKLYSTKGHMKELFQ